MNWLRQNKSLEFENSENRRKAENFESKCKDVVEENTRLRQENKELSDCRVTGEGKLLIFHY